MSINLPYVESISEKLHCILRSHKIRTTFYIENTEDENKIVNEIDCSNWKQFTSVNLNEL